MDHADHVALLRAGVVVPETHGGAATWADLGAGAGAFTLALADLLGPGSRSVPRSGSDGRLVHRSEALITGQGLPATVEGDEAGHGSIR